MAKNGAFDGFSWDGASLKEKSEEEDLAGAIKEVGKYKPGEKIKLTVKRGDKEKIIEITVGKRSDIIKD